MRLRCNDVHNHPEEQRLRQIQFVRSSGLGQGYEWEIGREADAV